MLENLDGTLDQQVGVLIVGAGPVGLCHALWLRQHEVDVLVIDANLRSHRDEWVVLGPDACEMLHKLGVRSEFENASIGYDSVLLLGAQRPAARKPRPLKLPVAALRHAPLSLVNRSALEGALERRARDLGAQIERGQRLQRVEVRPSHCEARVAFTEAEHESRAHPAVVPRDTARRVIAQWVIGTDGQHSTVRRDLRAAFRAIAEPRVASIVRLRGQRTFDDARTVQINAGKHAVHTLWSLDANSLLWVAQTSGPDIPDGMLIDHPGYEFLPPLAISTDAIRTVKVADGYIEREAAALGIQVEEVLSSHAIHYQPSVADPVGRGRAWTSGSAAQVVAPALGMDDTLGLLEVPDLALLLGFAAEDGLSGLPTLTPRLYQERRARLQQHALGAHPLGTDWSNQRGWSSHAREIVSGVFPFVTHVTMSPRTPASPPPSVQARG